MSSLPGLGALPMLVPLVTACVCLAVRESRGALVVSRVPCPPLGRGVVPMVLHRQIDAMIDEEPYSVLVPVDGSLVEDARRLVGAPVCVDVGTTLEEKQRDLEMPVQDRKRKRDVQNGRLGLRVEGAHEDAHPAVEPGDAKERVGVRSEAPRVELHQGLDGGLHRVRAVGIGDHQRLQP